MKLKTILAAALAVGITSSAMAQTTEITITGATAFRQATLQGIYDAYTSAGAIGTSFTVFHSGAGNTLSAMIAANQVVFQGQFPGITGTTIIRTSFNGSAEGLNAIAGNNDPAFLTVNAASPGSTILGGVTSPTETLRPKFSFSDVYQSTTPIDNEVLNPVGASAVGVVTFTMMANEGAPANLNNVTIQQARTLWFNGIQPLSLFTGDPADSGLYVFATGRNDGSGTRAAYRVDLRRGQPGQPIHRHQKRDEWQRNHRHHPRAGRRYRLGQLRNQRHEQRLRALGQQRRGQRWLQQQFVAAHPDGFGQLQRHGL
jgi:hypothetical protein